MYCKRKIGLVPSKPIPGLRIDGDKRVIPLTTDNSRIVPMTEECTCPECSRMWQNQLKNKWKSKL